MDGNEFDIENYNLEIIGARHSDFSYNPNNSLTPEQGEINIATNFFMRQLSRSTIDAFEWDNLVSSPSITYDEQRNVYIVDPIRFFEEENNE